MAYETGKLRNPDMDFAIIMRVFSKPRSAYRATGTIWTPEGVRTKVGLMIRNRGGFATVECDLFPCRLQWRRQFQDALSFEIEDYVKRAKPKQKWWAKGPTEFSFQIRSTDVEEWAIWLTILLSNPDHYELRSTWTKTCAEMPDELNGANANSTI